ncbi:4Fe-4S dicluster domain-containing protein [bacterium]|nr:4Fe-4S dicluster domain-containing protein [bacterium]
MSVGISGNSINREFSDKITEISGEVILKCMQCATCSGTCPMRDQMDLGPTRIMHFLQFGHLEEVLQSNTTWICASCQECNVRCPRDIDVSKVMEALRLYTLRDNIDFVNIPEIKKEKFEEIPPIAMVASFRKHTA